MSPREGTQREDERFIPERIAWLWSTYTPASFDRVELLSERYLLAREGRHSVYFGPIGACPAPSARIIFVGLTPGFQQLESAARLFATAPVAVRNDPLEYSRLLREHVAFKGTMRRNLCRMLDQIGIPKLLGVGMSEELFARGAEVAAATSALVFPVMVGVERRNYSGSRHLAKVPLFQTMIEVLLRPRLQRAANGLIIPLGIGAEAAVMYLVETGDVPARRVLRGFPHPSGANGHAARMFAENKARLRRTVEEWFA